MNNAEYKERVRLLLQLIPMVSKIDDFAIHGGTAINLFVLDLPRYSVDIDLTYIPIKSREETYSAIRTHLITLKKEIKRLLPKVVIEEKPNKISCSLGGVLVKVEVNGTKRGLIDVPVALPLCNLAQAEFSTFCEAKIVPLSQLYGGKIAAALDRQHPRDLFDVKLMFDLVSDFAQVKKGFLYCLLGGDRPIVESLSPNRVDHRDTLVKQFLGMTSMQFSYSDYEETREKIINFISSGLTQQDKEFLIAFEAGKDLSQFVEYQEYLRFPSVQWKLLNIRKFKEVAPAKHQESVNKLVSHFTQKVEPSPMLAKLMNESQSNKRLTQQQSNAPKL